MALISKLAALAFISMPFFGADAVASTLPLNLDLKAKAVRKLSPEDQAKLQEFLNDLSARIPSVIAEVAGPDVKVRFKSMGGLLRNGNEEGRGIVPPVCTDQKDEHGERVKGKKQHLGSEPNPNGNTVNINSEFIPVILKGEAAAATYGCGHGNTFRLAQATLVHEIGHIYDLRGRTETEGRVSGQQQFRFLMGFVRKFFPGLYDNTLFFPLMQKNYYASRLPDPYEVKNVRESFAVNLEFFVLDSEYACRKPAVNEYYESFFGETFQDGACRLNSKVQLSSSDMRSDLSTQLDLDFSRVYQIHYLLANAGPQLMSKWGHSMFRIVMCAPTRTEVGPDCLKDVRYHIVLSYRANLQGTIVNYVKGIIGKYPSQLYLFPWAEIASQYTKVELRDVQSVPLALTPQETKLFVYHTLEQLWIYQGKYTFFTNNCQTESRHFLLSILSDSRLKKLTSKNPIALMNELSKVGLADLSVLEDQEKAEAQGFSVPSARGTVEQAWNLLVKSGVTTADYVTYVQKTKASERIAWYNAWLKTPNLTIEVIRDTSAAYLYLESYVGGVLNARVSDDLVKKLEALQKKPDDTVCTLASNALRDATQMIATQGIGRHGYGVPLEEEAQLSNVGKVREMQNDAVEKMSKCAHENYDEDFKEVARINGNISIFSKGVLAGIPGLSK